MLSRAAIARTLMGASVFVAGCNTTPTNNNDERARAFFATTSTCRCLAGS